MRYMKDDEWEEKQKANEPSTGKKIFIIFWFTLGAILLIILIINIISYVNYTKEFNSCLDEQNTNFASADYVVLQDENECAELGGCYIECGACNSIPDKFVSPLEILKQRDRICPTECVSACWVP